MYAQQNFDFAALGPFYTFLASYCNMAAINIPISLLDDLFQRYENCHHVICSIILTIEKNLPPMILLLLVIYCLKDVQWIAAPYGIPELFSIGIVAGLHFWKRNAMLSIFIGTLLYMALVQFNLFSFL